MIDRSEVDWQRILITHEADEQSTHFICDRWSGRCPVNPEPIRQLQQAHREGSCWRGMSRTGLASNPGVSNAIYPSFT